MRILILLLFLISCGEPSRPVSLNYKEICNYQYCDRYTKNYNSIYLERWQNNEMIHSSYLSFDSNEELEEFWNTL